MNIARLTAYLVLGLLACRHLAAVSGAVADWLSFTGATLLSKKCLRCWFKKAPPFQTGLN
jgi:hypothetical protein